MPGLPPELDGLRIAHLSDFHLGRAVARRARRRGARSTGSPIAKPDLVCITGDLLSRPRGQAELDQLLERLPHAVRRARQPRLRALARPVLAAGPDRRADARDAALLTPGRDRRDRRRGCSVELAGVDPRTWLARRAESSFPPSHADLPPPAVPLPARARTRAEPGRFHLASPAICTAARSSCRSGSAACCSPIRASGTRRACSCAAARRCMFRRGSGRPSCRSGSSPAPRRPNSFYDPS